MLDIISQVFVDKFEKKILSLSLIAESHVISLWVYFENKMSDLTYYFKEIMYVLLLVVTLW